VGRVYEIVGFGHRLSVKPAPTMVCRGGFYQQYKIDRKQSGKPAPAQQIIQIDRRVRSHFRNVDSDLSVGGGGFLRFLVWGDYRWWNPPLR